MKKIITLLLITLAISVQSQVVNMVHITKEKHIVIHYSRLPDIANDTFKVDTMGVIHTTYDAFMNVCKTLSSKTIKSIHLQNIAVTINGKYYPVRFEVRYSDKTQQQFIVANLTNKQQKAFNDFVNECKIIIPIKPSLVGKHRD
jgi:hypothetical protein